MGIESITGVPPIEPVTAASLASMGQFGYTPPSSVTEAIRGITTSVPAVAATHAGNNLGDSLRATGIGGAAGKSRLSEMLGNIGSGVSILGDLASIYLGFQQNQLAKKQLGVQTGFANANLENTVKSYNTRLADIYRSRGYTQGDSAAATEQAISANSLNFKRIG